jgi:hypothetical protein
VGDTDTDTDTDTVDGVGKTVARSGLGVVVGVAVGVTALVVSPGVSNATVGGGGISVSKTGGIPVPRVVSSLPPNEPKSTNPQMAARTPVIAAVATSGPRLGPPYRPSGPLTRRPSSSTQNGQSTGAGGHNSCGDQRLGGRHRTVGGSGQPGGALKCLTSVSPPLPRG